MLTALHPPLVVSNTVTAVYQTYWRMETGSQQFRLADPASYYLWNIQEATQMLFTFSTDMQFTGMRLYFYYSDINCLDLGYSL